MTDEVKGNETMEQSIKFNEEYLTIEFHVKGEKSFLDLRRLRTSDAVLTAIMGILGEEGITSDLFSDFVNILDTASMQVNGDNLVGAFTRYRGQDWASNWDQKKMAFYRKTNNAEQEVFVNELPPPPGARDDDIPF